MKKILLIVGLAILTSGCACKNMSAPSKSTGLNGKWQFKDSFQGNDHLTFRSGDQFEFDYDGNGQQDVWGTYSLDWNNIAFLNKGGAISSDCEAEGKYKYILAQNELRFELQSDACNARTRSLEMIWVRK